MAVALLLLLPRGIIFATAQAPIAEEKATELQKIVFIDYGKPGRDPPGRQQEQEKKIFTVERLVLPTHAATVQVNMR